MFSDIWTRYILLALPVWMGTDHCSGSRHEDDSIQP